MQVIETRHMAELLSQAQAAANRASQQVLCSKELFSVDWANTLISAIWGTGLDQIIGETSYNS